MTNMIIYSHKASRPFLYLLKPLLLACLLSALFGCGLEVQEETNSDLVDSEAPVESTDPEEPAEPAEPAEPTDPAEPAEPAEPTDPTDTDPDTGTEPTEPTDSEPFTLFAPMNSKDTHLIDEQGNLLHSWSSDYRPGLSVYLLENGELLRTGSSSNNLSTFPDGGAGAGGIIEILDWDSNVVWQKSLATETYLAHHDIEQLPNGNILAVVWEAKTKEQALVLGRTSVANENLWAGAIYEICRAGEQNDCRDGEIVWKWSTWDHIVQSEDSSITSTYVSDVSEHQNKADINFFNGTGSEDWTHFNAVDYNESTDQILISVHNFSEYWVIDHANAQAGILSRVGNPAAYEGNGSKVLFVQHDAQWIKEGLPGAGNILVFNNGANRPGGSYSSVDEFCFNQNNCTLGEIVNSYSEGADGEFYASFISGAQRLENGNTLVCEGPEGRFFEFNANHEIVWEYIHGSSVFRAVRYNSDYPGLTGRF